VRIVVKLSSIQIWMVLCGLALFIRPATSAAQLGPDTRPTKGSSVSVSPKAVKETEKALRALQQNKLEDAQQYLVRALAADPNFADGNYLMGLLLLRRKESGRAVAYLQKSLEVSPNHTAALLALGEFLSIDYAPVRFRARNVQVWLPQSADSYEDLAVRRTIISHKFSNFLLFSVQTDELIVPPQITEVDRDLVRTDLVRQPMADFIGLTPDK
jgi:hypothetical protein